MKITALNTRMVNIPLKKPIATAIHEISSVGCLLVEISSDQDKGVSGEGHLFAINATRLKAFKEMVTGLSHQVVGRNPFFIEAIWQDIFRELNPSGQKGIGISALSAIDMACWDLVGKITGKPLWQIFGACRDRVKTYASSGLWLSDSIDQLIEQANQFIKQGFRSIKMRVGNSNLKVDVERVKQVRSAIGDDVELLLDANQAYTPKEAIRFGQLVETYQPYWLEEPVPYNDLAGHRLVREALPINITTGETEFTGIGMRSIIESEACDILMPDLQRVGGFSEFNKIVGMTAIQQLPISTHMFTEASLAIAGSARNCISVEHFDWFTPLFREKLEIEAGEIILPHRPGIGFTFDQGTLKNYQLD